MGLWRRSSIRTHGEEGKTKRWREYFQERKTRRCLEEREHRGSIIHAAWGGIRDVSHDMSVV